MRRQLFTTFTFYLTVFQFVGTEIQQPCESENRCQHEVNEILTLSRDDRSKQMTEMGERKPEMALVLYNEDSVLPFRKPERAFHFVNRDILIKQKWANLGVAAVVWDAAVVLCQYLESNPSVVKGKRVIELGAGTGLVGMVSGLLGGETTITDRDEVINFLEQTIDENIGLQNGVPVHITALDWTQDLSKFEQFDIILGADIVYIEDSFDDLLRTFVHLSRKDTTIYLSCRIRYERDTNFLTQMETKFYIEEILYDSITDVKLYKAHKR